MNKTVIYICILACCIFAACSNNESGKDKNDGGVSAPDSIPAELKANINSDTTVTKNATISDSAALNIAKNIPDSTKIEKKEKTRSLKPSQITFNQKTHQYGTIKQGDQVDHTFSFKNTGERPLNIQNAYASCGCTQPTFSFLPINPGKTGEIQVTFDSKGKKGPQKSKITIETDGNPKTVYLYLEGIVDDTAEKTEPQTDSLNN